MALSENAIFCLVVCKDKVLFCFLDVRKGKEKFKFDCVNKSLSQIESKIKYISEFSLDI